MIKITKNTNKPEIKKRKKNKTKKSLNEIIGNINRSIKNE